ncbi:NUDIX domain-containing protein [Natrarchaeobaculum aegyptiacum]|uniref:NUDIX hydrolase n=1 Tax=Natrarchaeobaculum aegyptiacum TaxID=745377 RepID=A0A2Z2HSJ6_9EURY|nr:NUDIX domain-containing protein [Natrarchaeobaculum aegyptiacum]ARS90119.1 NUDIX hydrolase [Natrarchaeobaculum aegyptiacum]
MVSRPAEFCPRCGSALETITFDGRERANCPACDRVVWHNPVPCAGVAVVDGGGDETGRDGDRHTEPAVLCVKRGVPPGVGEWTIPGGHMEVGEEPAAAAARELEEETGISVDPDALEILDATNLPPRTGKHVVTIHYVVERSATTGVPSAGSDAMDARFFSPGEFDASDEAFRPIHEQRFRAAAARFE